MRIQTVRKSEEPHGVEIEAHLGQSEFRQLRSRLSRLALVAGDLIDEPASHIKTGARHSAAKYLLFPVKLRRQHPTKTFDFDQLKCTTQHYRDYLLIVYKVAANLAPRKNSNQKNSHR